MSIGTGATVLINVAIIDNWWQKENRGFAVGTHHTGFPFSPFFGPLLIGAVVFGWQLACRVSGSGAGALPIAIG